MEQSTHNHQNNDGRTDTAEVVLSSNDKRGGVSNKTSSDLKDEKTSQSSTSQPIGGSNPLHLINIQKMSI